MHNVKLQTLAKVSLIIFLYIFTYYTFFAFNSKPTDGDSLDYHIPIAKMILQGSIVNPKLLSHVNPMRYSPGSSEGLLSILIFFHVPLNLYNIFGFCVLCIVLYFLGITVGMEKNYSIIFATTFSTIHGVVRWLPTQVIDIWLAVFFTLTLILLQKPEKKSSYFIILGCTAGMLVGTKYTGPIFLLILCLFYLKDIFKIVNIQRIILFFIPFSILGSFWYIRNYLFTGDPYFPQSIPFFKGVEWHIFDWAVWKIIFLYPTGLIRTLNAFLSEYTIWSLSIPLCIIFLLWGYGKVRKEKYRKISKLILVGLLNFIIYFFMPSGPHDNLMVTGFRYTYPAFIPLVLSVFLIFEILKKQELLAVLSIINMVMLTEMSYHPKILLAFIPLGTFFYFYNSKNIFYMLRSFSALPIQFSHKKKK